MNDRRITCSRPPQRRSRALACAAAALLCLPACRDPKSEADSLRVELRKAENFQDESAVAELSQRLLEFDPGADDLREKMVRALLSTGQLELVTQRLNAWEKRPPPRPAVLDALRGEVAFAGHNDREAIAHWRRYLAAKPGDTDVLDRMAQAAARCEDWAGSERLLIEALAIEPRAGRFAHRAETLLRQRKLDAALADMVKAHELDPSDPQVTQWLPRFELLKKSLPELRQFDEQIATAPLGIDLLLGRAELLQHAGQPELALDDARRALQMEPDSVRARLQTGEALLQLGRQEEAGKLRVNATQPHKPIPAATLRAIGEMDAQVADNPGDASVLAARAAALHDAHQFLLALDSAEAALKLEPKNAPAHRAAGRALLSLGRTSEATARLTRATRLAQNDSAAWLDRARAEIAMANHPAAIASLTRSLALEETVEALTLREKSFRSTGQAIDADLDHIRIRQLGGAASK